MQFILVHTKEELGPLQHLRQHIMAIDNALKNQKIKKFAKKENEQIHQI